MCFIRYSTWVCITDPMYTYEHTLNTPISLVFGFDECGRPAHMRPFAIPIECFSFFSYHFCCGVAFNLIYSLLLVVLISQFIVKPDRDVFIMHISIHRIRVFVQTDNISIFQAHSLELFKWPKCKQILFENNIHKYDWHNVNNYVASQEVCFNKNCWIFVFVVVFFHSLNATQIYN